MINDVKIYIFTVLKIVQNSQVKTQEGKNSCKNHPEVAYEKILAHLKLAEPDIWRKRKRNKKLFTGL